MRRSKTAALACALALAAGAAWAQDPPREDAPTFEDLKKNLGELKEKKDKEDAEKRDAQVQKNMEETLKIYKETLEGRGVESATVDKRLSTNRALDQKYTRLLDEARAELGRLRASYVARTLTLKKSLEEKKVTPQAYEKLLEDDTRKYRNREKELVDDIAFYDQELAAAKTAARELGVKKELLDYDPFSPEDASSAAAGAKAPKTGLADRVQKKVTDLSGFRRRSIVDVMD